MLYGLLLEENAPRDKKKKTLKEAPAPRTEAVGGAEPKALPTARAFDAPPAYAPPGRETAEVSAPASVTESTTRLLDDEANP